MKDPTSDRGMVTAKTLWQFRKMIDGHERFTDEQLVNVLVMLATMDMVFSRIPSYLPPVVRMALAANEAAPAIMASFVNAKVIDPIALTNYMNESDAIEIPTKNRLLN